MFLSIESELTNLIHIVFFVFLSGAQAANRDVVLTQPAETVHAAVKKILPLTIPTQGSTVQGQLILESLVVQ